MLILFLLIALSSGQLIKIPLDYGGITILDIFVFGSSLFLLWKSKFRLSKPPLFLSAALIFIFFAALSLFLTPLKLTPQETLISLSYLIRFSFYILFAWLLYSVKYLKAFIKVFVKAGLILSILGLIQLVFLPDLRFLSDQGWDPHYFRTVSTFLDPNFLGAFLVLTLLPIIKKKQTLLTITCFVLIFIALLTTFSRSSYIAFGVSFFSLSFLSKSTKLIGLTIVLMFLLLTGFSIYQKMVSVPKNIDRIESASYRINSWAQGWEIFQKNPVLGVGFNTYRFALSRYQLAPEEFIKSHGASGNDSSLLFVAATTGIFGLVSFVVFLFTMFLQGKGNPIFLAGFLGLTAQSFFANILFYPFILIWIALNAPWEKPK